MAELNPSNGNRPKNVRVEYHIEMLINTGNFQNMKPAYTVSADVPDGVNPNEVLAKLESLAEARLQAKVDEIQADLAGN